MTANATNNFTSITDPISVKVAGDRSRGWTHSTGTVSVSFIPYNPSSAKDPSVRLEGGQDCQKAQGDAQASGAINSAEPSSANLAGSGPQDSAGSFFVRDIDMIGGQPSGGVKAELPDGWGGVLT